MPVEVGIWKIDGDINKLNFCSIENEKKLEATLCSNLDILDTGFLLIGNQVQTVYGKSIDILAMNYEGDLVVIELKKNRTPREVTAQILDYASWIENLEFEHIKTIFSEKNAGQEFEDAYLNKFQTDLPERINDKHRLIIVASELDFSTERIIDYLSKYGVPVNAVFFRYFKVEENEFLVRSWLIDPKNAEEQIAKSPTSRKRKETWNGLDWYVSFGLDSRRDWEDCRKYGFISAGGGKWYSNTLKLLPLDGRIFVYVPQHGFVGVGQVVRQAVPVTEFTVEINGEEKSILEVKTNAKDIGKDAEDLELSEWLVGVKWIKNVRLDEAVWEKGMFANQNSACKLRHSYTIERLTKRFALDEE